MIKEIRCAGEIGWWILKIIFMQDYRYTALNNRENWQIMEGDQVRGIWKTGKYVHELVMQY
jgi:hypothetical protein